MKRTWTRFLLYAAAAGMEVSWFWAALNLLTRRVSGGSLSPLTILGFYPLAFLFHRALRKFKRSRALLWSGLAWAALVLLLAKIDFFSGQGWWDAGWLRAFGDALGRMFQSMNPEALAVMSSAVLWGFGWRLAAVKIRFSTLVSEFQFGLAVLLTLFLLNAQWELSTAALIPLTLSFFFSALGGIAVSHASERESWLSGHYRDRWFAFLLLTIGFILGIGWLISAVVNPSLIESLLSFLAVVGQWIWAWIAKIFIFLIELIPSPKPGELPPATHLPQMKGPAEAPFILFSDSVREVIRFIWGAGVISLLLIALWRVSSEIFEWFRRKMGGMGEAEVEPLPGAFREDLLNFLKKLLRIFGIAWPFGMGRRVEPLLPGVDWVRKTYLQLSAWGAKKGHARNPAQTPYEYLSGLVVWLPERGEDFTLITEQYVRTRYGLSVPTENRLEELRESWQRIRQTRFKKDGKNKGKEISLAESAGFAEEKGCRNQDPGFRFPTNKE